LQFEALMGSSLRRFINPLLDIFSDNFFTGWSHLCVVGKIKDLGHFFVISS
jgi:hypothetical protein